MIQPQIVQKVNFFETSRLEKFYVTCNTPARLSLYANQSCFKLHIKNNLTPPPDSLIADFYPADMIQSIDILL